MISDLKRKLADKGRVSFNIKVRTKAGRTEVREVMDDGVLKIDVNSVPFKGAANKELIKYLSDVFEVLPNNVIIKRGLKNKDKLIEIFK